MNIYFTGSSSFTGYHFIDEFNKNNIKLNILFSFKQKDIAKYEQTKKLRIKKIIKNNYCHYNTKFGSSNFFKIIKKSSKIDIFCHHFAYTENYKSDNFDLNKAINEGTKNLYELFRILQQKKIKKYLYSGSYFENQIKNKTYEHAFSKYGLSKSIIGQILKFNCYINKIKYSKIIISNPFGQFEDSNRITSIIAKTWISNKKFILNFPKYKRDYIPIEILKKEYFNCAINKKITISSPRYYGESNIKFLKRFQKEFKKRTNYKCEIGIKNNSKYIEPIKRFNDKKININDNLIWNDLIKYYIKKY